MPRIEMTTLIRAPREVVFDLARDLDLHQESQASKQERAVAGKTSGKIELGESVTWEAVHIGIRQRLTSKITAMDPPNSFRDSMVSGAFRRFDHDHLFLDDGEGGTEMRDVFDYTSPAGWLGRVVDRLFLTLYMRRLLSERNDVIRQHAERLAGHPPVPLDSKELP